MYNIEEEGSRIYPALNIFVCFLLLILLFVKLRRSRVERFREACKTGNLEDIANAIGNNALMKTLTGITSEEVSVGFMWACSAGHLQVVERLLDVEELYENRFCVASSFMCACKRGHLDIVQRMIKDSRVPLDIVNKNGCTPEQITKVPEIKEMIRKEHWNRVQREINEITNTLQLTVDNLKNMKKDGTSPVFMQALELKLAEVKRKNELLESKEKKELRGLQTRFDREKEHILTRYDDETREMKKSIEQDVMELKTLI